jgi:hypothetical protein
MRPNTLDAYPTLLRSYNYLRPSVSPIHFPSRGKTKSPELQGSLKTNPA